MRGTNIRHVFLLNIIPGKSFSGNTPSKLLQWLHGQKTVRTWQKPGISSWNWEDRNVSKGNEIQGNYWWLKVRELIRKRMKESCVRQLQAGMKGYNLQITFAVILELKASFLLLVQSTCTIK